MRPKLVFILSFLLVIIMYLCLFTTTIEKWIDGHQILFKQIIVWTTIDTNQNESLSTSTIIQSLLEKDNTPKFYDYSNGTGRKNRNKVNANAMFRNLWFAVQRKDPYIYHIDTRRNISDHDNLHIYVLRNKEILNTRYRAYLRQVIDKKWTKIVIIRDPLERVMTFEIINLCIISN